MCISLEGHDGRGDIPRHAVVLVNAETDSADGRIGETEDKAEFDRALADARGSDTRSGWDVTPNISVADIPILAR